MPPPYWDSLLTIETPNSRAVRMFIKAPDPFMAQVGNATIRVVNLRRDDSPEPSSPDRDRSITPSTIHTNSSSAPPSEDASGPPPASGDKHPRDGEDEDRGPADLAAIKKRILGIKRMRPENQALFEQSLHASREEREALRTALQIWTYEAIDWRVDGDLEKTIEQYAYAYIYAPGIKSYKVGATFQVLSLLKESNPGLMPEPLHLEKVVQAIKRELTTARSHLKLTVKNAIDRHTLAQKGQSDKASDIATVCSLLVKKGRPQIRFTAQHYARVAFIRWALGQFSAVAEAQFWTKVDENLFEMRNQLDAEEQNQFFKHILAMDKDKYGEPAHNVCPLSSTEDLEIWQVLCEQAAEMAVETGAELDLI